ncbi:hypothetical protein [Salinimicrobium oceani]|uniref:Uncharacterized protein n=1 Tax=Salinimicrobium oceani TaxID=2722702 RepID=A0ABX1CYF4_9FLAO|nr:hypothetical protein [Salinimicrobium oceani]NJW53292.1 hypothetical protein [Salinimicrobium oceani]
MKFRNLFFAAILVFGFSACRDTAREDHGHEHEEGVEAHAHEEEEHGHPHDEDGGHMQEEFTVGEDSLDIQEESGHHTHDDGTEHEAH